MATRNAYALRNALRNEHHEKTNAKMLTMVGASTSCKSTPRSGSWWGGEDGLDALEKTPLEDGTKGTARGYPRINASRLGYF